MEDRWKGIKAYFEVINGPVPGHFNKHSPSNNFAKRIGVEPADSIPHNAFELYSANLNYKPRPTLQSYVAFTPDLDRRNADFITQNGPKFIVYSNGCIDDRYCIFDETKTKLALLSNYNLADFEAGKFLLERREEPLKLITSLSTSGIISLGQELKISASNSIKVAEFDVNYSLYTKILRLIYKPAFLKIEIKSGATFQIKRAILPILKGGVIINLAQNSTSDVKAFLTRDFSAITKVDSIKLVSDDLSGFAKDVHFKIYDLSFASH